LDLCNIQETLYTTLHPNWLSIILFNCPNLASLRICDASYLNDECIDLLNIFHHPLIKLSLPKCNNLRPLALQDFILRFHQLQDLEITESIGLTDQVLFNLSQSLRLRRITVSSCPFVSDIGIIPFVSSPFYNLTSLTIAECTKITDQALFVIANENSTLSLNHIDFRQCKSITDTGLSELILKRGKILKKLSILGCSSVQFNTSLLKVLSSHCTSLIHLGLSFHHLADPSPTITSTKIQYLRELSTLSQLWISNVTSLDKNSVIWSLGWLEGLKCIVVERESIESDFVGGMYTDGDFHQDNDIEETFYNDHQGRVRLKIKTSGGLGGGGIFG